jgi:hypothetical protein
MLIRPPSQSSSTFPSAIPVPVDFRHRDCALDFLTRLGEPAQLHKQVSAHTGKQMIPSQGRVTGEPGRSIECIQSSGRALNLTNGDSLGFGYPATADRPDQPRGHSESNWQSAELPLDESYQLAVCLWPAGAVHCSIGDLALYATDHLNGLRGRRALLPQEMYQRLHRPLDGGDNGYTLGWGVRQDKRWGAAHFGAGTGGWFFVRIEIVPEHDAAVVVASNSGQAADATKELIAGLLEIYAAEKESGKSR